MNVEDAFEKRLRNIPLTARGHVVRILEDDRDESPHQRFIIQVHSGHTILIAHNLERAYRVPVKIGDSVEVHGDYVWNKYGGIIHNTHHSNQGEHTDGWINFVGLKDPTFSAGPREPRLSS